MNFPPEKLSPRNPPESWESLHVEAIIPFLEMGAYELLWKQHGTWSRLSRFLKQNPLYENISAFVKEEDALQCAEDASQTLEDAGINWFGVRLRTEAEYGDNLREAVDIPPCLYFQGYWNLTETPSVSVIGTRKPSDGGIHKAKKLVRHLVEDGFTVVSGLARGIDTVAHKTALEEGGKTIAVMGTPLQDQYPEENRELRDTLATEHLVITQFPVVAKTQNYFFPERNRTMSALSGATVIVEAGETSGTKTQAKAALEQGRLLFILDSCINLPGLTWPEKFEAEGAIKVRDYRDIRERLSIKH